MEERRGWAKGRAEEEAAGCGLQGRPRKWGDTDWEGTQW